MRYLILLPCRLVVLLTGMIAVLLYVSIVAIIPSSSLKEYLRAKCSIFCFDLVAGSLSLVATFHYPENRPQNGIAVANHTSPIDSVVLATDNYYDMVNIITLVIIIFKSDKLFDSRILSFFYINGIE